MITLQVHYSDSYPSHIFRIQQADSLNAFYAREGFLIIKQDGQRTYIPAHRIREAIETVEVESRPTETETMGLRQILLIVQGCDLWSTTHGRQFVETITKAFEIKVNKGKS